MANDLNQCTFTGRLGRDPETRAFPSGDEVTSLRLAVGSKWRDKQTGEVKERTEWISVICSGGLSKVASQDGQKRYATEIRADKMQMLGSRQSQSDQGDRQAQDSSTKSYQAPQQAQRQAPPQTQPRPASGFDDMDDSIPF